MSNTKLIHKIKREIEIIFWDIVLFPGEIILVWKVWGLKQAIKHIFNPKHN
jgi:hypothetical protein